MRPHVRACQTSGVQFVNSRHLSTLLKVALCILMTIHLMNEPFNVAAQTVTQAAEAVQCTETETNPIVAPVLVEKNQESWVTAIDVSKVNKIAMAIKSKK